MGLNAKDAADAARDIAANAVERASDIVESASGIIRGDIAGGTEGILHSATDIATYAFDRTKEALTGAEGDELE